MHGHMNVRLDISRFINRTLNDLCSKQVLIILVSIVCMADFFQCRSLIVPKFSSPPLRIYNSGLGLYNHLITSKTAHFNICSLFFLRFNEVQILLSATSHFFFFSKKPLTFWKV